MNLARQPLQGRFVRLEPYAEAHREGVRAALDCDPETWAVFSRAGFGEHFAAWWADALRTEAAGEAMPFAVLAQADGRVMGATSFLSIRPAHRVVEIGATWLHPDVRGGPANPESKRLMLGAAFAAGAHRAEFMIDVRNTRSQAAVAKLGALREGVLRRQKITWTGHVRDTAVFSVTDLDWPQVRARLDARLAAFSAPAGS